MPSIKVKKPYKILSPQGIKMGPKAQDLSGMKLGKLKIIERVGTDKWGDSQWLCLCDCGEKIIKSRNYFFRRKKNFPIKSCGCAHKHRIKKDLTNKKFGRWFVIKHEDKTNSRGQHFWLCRCNCGNEKVVSADSLISGNSKSCGCYCDEVRLQGLKPGEAGFNKLYHSYKKSAQERSLSFNLSKDVFKKLVIANCCYCGKPPYKTMKFSSSHSSYSSFLYNGIDRIDNNLGYGENNVCSCCERCNRMKYNFTKEEFIEQCRIIYTYRCHR